MIDLFYLRSNNKIGNGITDDTQIIQDAINEYSDVAKTGVVRLPVGVYRITKTLTYRGNHGYGMSFIGEIAAAGPSGSVLKWDGPKNGTMIDFLGALGSSIEGIAFNGSAKAGIGIAINFDYDRSVGCSNVLVSRCHLGGVLGTAISIGIKPDGTNDDKQVDAIMIEKCLLVGNGQSGETAFGINTGWGNVKNFSISDCGVSRFNVGIRHGGSGYMDVQRFRGGGNLYSDFVGSTGNFNILSGNSEGSARLFVGGTGRNPGSVSIENFSWASSKTPGNGWIVQHQGIISLRYNTFWDNKWPGAVPLVRLDNVGGTPSTLESVGNYFANAVDWLPVIDAKGNPPSSSMVRSHGDYGGPKGEISFLRLKESKVPQFARSAMSTAMNSISSITKLFK